jgi:hypothetical protein
VIFGIAVEAIDLIVKCGENEGFCKWFGDSNRFEEMNLNRLKRFSKFFHPWTLAIEIASFALVVYGLSAEISGSSEAYRISGLQTTSLNEKYVNEYTNSVALSLKVEELRKQNNELGLIILYGKATFFDAIKFGKALNGKPQMSVKILYPPNDEHAMWFGMNLSGGFDKAGWTNLIDLRPYNDDDVVLPKISNEGLSSWQKMPLSMRMGTQNATVTLVTKAFPQSLYFETNSQLRAVCDAIDSFPYLSAVPAQFENPRLERNELEVVIGPGF